MGIMPFKDICRLSEWPPLPSQWKLSASSARRLAQRREKDAMHAARRKQRQREKRQGSHLRASNPSVSRAPAVLRSAGGASLRLGCQKGEVVDVVELRTETVFLDCLPINERDAMRRGMP